jgi:hypothetical protein
MNRLSNTFWINIIPAIIITIELILFKELLYKEYLFIYIIGGIICILNWFFTIAEFVKYIKNKQFKNSIK